MPKISIITTTYKHQNFIAQTIESVLAQTFADWELLIWDDSPDDETWNIIQKYVKKYPDKIKAWHHNPNKWIVENMKFLLSKVSKESDYIAFLEWDDMFTSDNLEKRINYFKLNNNVKFIYNWYKIIDKYWKIKKNTNIQKWKNFLSFNDFLDFPTLNPIKSFGCVMLRKEIFNFFYPIRKLNNKKMFWNTDFLCWLKIIEKWINIYFLDKTIFLYREHDNNYSIWNNNISMIKE